MEEHKQPKQPPYQKMPPMKMFAFGVIAGILILCTIGFFIFLALFLKGGGFSSKETENTVKVADNTRPRQPAKAVSDIPTINNDDHIKGAKNAKVTLVEYSDFECPFCGRFAPTIRQVLDKYPNDVRVVYRHFPLSFHPQARPAAEASECAAEQNKFWEFHDKLFEDQKNLSSDLYKKIARDIGLNVNKFNDCVSSGKYSKKVREQQDGGAAAGVGGTPHTFVIGPNGRKTSLSGALPFDQVKSAIDGMLN